MSTRRDPSAVYTPIPNDDLIPGRPINCFLMGALRDGVVHCREVTKDPAIHVDTLGHAHRGWDSAHLLSAPNTPNLITTGMITSVLSSIVWGVTLHEWAIKGLQITDQGFLFGTANQYATHVLVDRDRPKNSLSVFGQRCDVVLSCYLRATTELTEGILSFGLVDGGPKVDDTSKQYPSGMRVLVPATIIPSDKWVRVWAVLQDVAATFNTTVRFAIQCERAPKGANQAPAGIWSNYHDARPGRALDFYTHGYHTDTYLDWLGFGYTTGGMPPPLDETIALTNAVKLAAA